MLDGPWERTWQRRSKHTNGGFFRRRNMEVNILSKENQENSGFSVI